MSGVPDEVVGELMRVAHTLGERERELAVLGEGNVSVRVGDDRMLVKASGANLGQSRPQDFVECRTAPILALLERPDATDEDVAGVLLESRVDPGAGRPSVEALFHAVAIAEGAGAVAHTHPVSALGILCSDQREALVAGPLFPDQIVVLGPHLLLLPYVDPGLELGRVFHREIVAFRERHGVLPKAVYLTNHGLVAIGDDPAECVRITEMADKHARVLGVALSVGKPVLLPNAVRDRIDQREDEHHRRAVLGTKGR